MRDLKKLNSHTARIRLTLLGSQLPTPMPAPTLYTDKEAVLDLDLLACHFQSRLMQIHLDSMIAPISA